MLKKEVSFKFKEKGKKPINVTEIAQFLVSGADFKIDKVCELLSTMGLAEME